MRQHASVVCMTTFMISGLLLGCGGGNVAPLAKEQILGARDWSLSQGSTLSSSMKLKTIDEFTTLGSAVVRHSRSASEQHPSDRVEMRFIGNDDGMPSEWIQMASADPEGSSPGLIQNYEMPFSAPAPWKLDFRVTIQGKPEELTGWSVTPPE